MNKMPENEVVVLALAGNSIKVICTKALAKQALVALGFTARDEQMDRSVKDDSERRQLTLQLISLDALFSGGPGWSPAELLGYYREQNIITEAYRTIVWKGPGVYIIETH
ncbi:MAG: hypothetical protein WBG81_12875 [Rhodanobacter sp.]|jgi:hypothetical protein|uniref:hypothetical protein n=1 Tax=Rhodanobacter sp. KK11 TaxID=3083255 RepID=UPI002966C89E|nr:hypothetical protein [Rhodanobacter sp. KK11]MDW2982549.1 hypothetical protein [Rhodanobacter sp. KK11]